MNRIQILNLSFAGPEDRLLERLIGRANLEGIVVVAAVDESEARLGFPASLPEVIAVCLPPRR